MTAASGPRPGRTILVLVLALGLAACADREPATERAGAGDELATQLRALPYATRARVKPENRGLRGVVKHDDGRAAAGLNLYGSLTDRKIFLRDMAGEPVHSWAVPDVFGDRRTFPLSEDLELINTPYPPGILLAELRPGYVLAIESHIGLLKLDEDSQVLFALNNNAHHDVDVDAGGRVFVLTARPRNVRMPDSDLLIVDDIIQVLAPDGDVLAQHSVFDILARDPDLNPVVGEALAFAQHWSAKMEEWRDAKIATNPAAAASYRAVFALHDEVFVQRTRRVARTHEIFLLLLTPADVLHTNTLELLDDHPDGLWRAGNVLVSVRNLDLIAVLDLEAGAVAWSWGRGELSRQHQPSALADGNVLVFDNGTSRSRSRIVEVDPASGRIVWTYGDTPASRFFCGAMGGVHRLPNGNTLITDSSAGRAFEVNPQGDVVWDFFNPELGFNPFDKRPGAETIESIYRMVRVLPAVPGPWDGRE